MKITYFQLEQQLSRRLPPVFVISGEDVLLKQDCIQMIRQAAKKAGFTERARLKSDTAIDAEELFNLLNVMPLMGGMRTVELDFNIHLPTKSAAEVLAAYLQKPNPDNLLIIDMDKLEDKVTRSEWYQACDKIGVTVTIWPIPREQLPQWIMQRAQKYQMTFTHDGAATLADFIEGNLSAAAQNIEKIFLLQPKKPVDASLVNAVLTDESRFNLFDFVENLVAGEKTRAFHILNNLKNEGTEPTLILWAITRELRILSDMADQRKQGATYDALFKKHRVFARRQSAVRHFLRNRQAEDCYALLTQAITVDESIKGANPGNLWDAIEMFCLRMVVY